MTATNHASAGDQVETRGLKIDDKTRSVLVVLVGSAALITIAFATMMLLTSPDGWVMKAANQAMVTAQQGTLASYDLAAERPY